jgi:DNA-binding XRE family transcriptional regulator
MKTLLQKHREAIKPKTTVQAVADAIGVNRSTMYRIEAGDVAPTRQTARAIFDHYAGAVPLAHCYDPKYARREDRRRAA